jgi:hypothetical protein
VASRRQWLSPTTRRRGGNISIPPPVELARLVPGQCVTEEGWNAREVRTPSEDALGVTGAVYLQLTASRLDQGADRDLDWFVSRFRYGSCR